MSGDRDDVTNRLSRRFDSDDEEGVEADEGDDDETATETDATNAGNEGKAQSDRDADADGGGSNATSDEGGETDPGADETDDEDDEYDWVVKNVKEEWKGATMYLPDPLSGDVGKAYKQLDLELDDDLTKFQKTRHFYPLLVEAGKERLEGMERNEIMERLEGIDPDLETFRPDDS